MELVDAMAVSASGMKAQGARVRVIAENIANANSIAEGPGQEPYRRKLITFRNELDRASGVDMVKANRIILDESPFGLKFEPNHPYADDDGYIRTPNVKTTIEMMDMRQATRAYEANLNAIGAARSMLQRTVELLRS